MRRLAASVTLLTVVAASAATGTGVAQARDDAPETICNSADSTTDTSNFIQVWPDYADDRDTSSFPGRGQCVSVKYISRARVHVVAGSYKIKAAASGAYGSCKTPTSGVPNSDPPNDPDRVYYKLYRRSGCSN